LPPPQQQRAQPVWLRPQAAPVLAPLAPLVPPADFAASAQALPPVPQPALRAPPRLPRRESRCATLRLSAARRVRRSPVYPPPPVVVWDPSVLQTS